MDSIKLVTPRCLLRMAVIEDAEWMLRLFKDKEVVAYIDGIKWFNTNVESMRSFIMSMDKNFQESKGILWSVIVDDCPAGIIMANDLEETPYLTFALFEEYRRKNIGSEVYNVVKEYITAKYEETKVETRNPVVEKITKRKCEYLFIGNRYYSSLSELKDTLANIASNGKTDKNVIEEILSGYRDDTLTKWLFYLAQEGDEEALDAAYSLCNLSKETGDRALFPRILKILCTDGNRILNYDISSLIRLNPRALIRCSLEELEINIYNPIHLETDVSNCELTLFFDILQSSHDTIDVEINKCHKNVYLGTKKKTIPVIFQIDINRVEEEGLDVLMDGNVVHTLHFQMYPNKDWDNKTCTLEGIRHLYLQEYKKATLCFNRYRSAADLFWLGVMEYIGAGGEPNPQKALLCFRNTSSSDNSAWACVGEAMMALMTFKGEGVKADIDKAMSLIAKYPDTIEGIAVLRNALSGNLKEEVYHTFFYSYNISDRLHIPQFIVSQGSAVITPRYLLDTCNPFCIVVNANISSAIRKVLSENDSLHAYIGVMTQRKGDWQYVIENDWVTNAAYNTLCYDTHTGSYRIEINNLNVRQNIVPNEGVLKVNLILRNSDGTKQFPQDGSYYAIDCFTSSSHIALCNISLYLLKFPEISSVFNSLNLVLDEIR